MHTNIRFRFIKSHSDSKLLRRMLSIESKSHEVMKHVKGCVRIVEPQRPPTGRMQRWFMYHSLFRQPANRNDEISSVLPLFHLSTGAGSHPITQLSEHDCLSQCWTITAIQRSVPIMFFSIYTAVIYMAKPI